MKKHFSFFLFILVSFTGTGFGQKQNDVTAPLHALQPDYPVPYTIPTAASIKEVLDRVYQYLDSVTPPQFIYKKTGQVVISPADADTTVIFKPGDFRLTSYEWGVTYAAMLQATKTTGDPKFADYTKKRMEFLAEAYPAFSKLYEKYPKNSNPLRQMVAPHALDDAGAMCAAMIRLYRETKIPSLRPVIDHYIDYVFTKEYRLPDGTIARNRPQKNTLWLDDLYMAIPAIAQMGQLTGDHKYFDDAVKQFSLYASRMFNKELNIYMHGWVEGMDTHPEFHWGRANGWAILALTELLEVLPANHPGRQQLLELLKAHAKGLAALQSGTGFWHQLLDRNDSYLETSATAIYTYCIAKSVNQGWLDAKAYAALCLLGWNAVTTKVNEKGQVEGTCVGTGMAFDPAFYYYRPINVFAAHGYGPVIAAGAEIYQLIKNQRLGFNDSSIQANDQ